MMMDIKAEAKYNKISASKVRLVAKTLRGLPLDKALTTLSFAGKKSAVLLKKVLQSAIANAQHNGGLEKDKLTIKKIEVGQGPTLKRWRARSRGMAHPILKRTSHITIILEGAQEKKEPKEKKAK